MASISVYPGERSDETVFVDAGLPILANDGKDLLGTKVRREETDIGALELGP
jgi:hypothetical protein